jgi:hypothetical protein
LENFLPFWKTGCSLGKPAVLRWKAGYSSLEKWLVSLGKLIAAMENLPSSFEKLVALL